MTGSFPTRRHGGSSDAAEQKQIGIIVGLESAQWPAPRLNNAVPRVLAPEVANAVPRVLAPAAAPPGLCLRMLADRQPYELCPARLVVVQKMGRGLRLIHETGEQEVRSVETARREDGGRFSQRRVVSGSGSGESCRIPMPSGSSVNGDLSTIKPRKQANTSNNKQASKVSKQAISRY